MPTQNQRANGEIPVGGSLQNCTDTYKNTVKLHSGTGKMFREGEREREREREREKERER